VENYTTDYRAIEPPVITSTTKHVVGTRTVFVSSGYQRVLADGVTEMYAAYFRVTNRRVITDPKSNIAKLLIVTTDSNCLPLYDTAKKAIELGEICAVIYVGNGCLSGWSENLCYTPEEEIQYEKWYEALCVYWDEELQREKMAAREVKLDLDDHDHPKERTGPC